MFCSPCPEVDINETGHVRSTFIANPKNGKTIRKAYIMESKNFFTKKVRTTAVNSSASENIEQ